MMTVGRIVEALEQLQFNKHEEARLMIDPGVQAFLLRAAKAAAADHLDAKVRTCGARSGRRDERAPLPAAVVR
jgi:hypothetical protein